MAARQVTWYYDFLSPFSYLAHAQLHRLPADVDLRYRPVLFAGLLNHWGTKGPAELASQRLFTFRYCQWLARRQEVPFRVPAAHPFNPLPPLRLSLALDNKPQAVARIFAWIWQEGHIPEHVSDWETLLETFHIEGLPKRMQSPEVKQRLRDNTEAAIAQGVFGVPTFIVDGELFWGQDGYEFLLDYLAEPALLESAEMQRIARLPVGASRTP